MALKDKNLAALIAKAAEIEDQTQVVSGGDFERSIPDAGVTVGRFIEYIDLGQQPRAPWKGKERSPVESVRLVFELTHPNNVREITLADGSTKQVADKIVLRSINKSFSDKGNFKKLFDKMRYGRSDITHMAQMLGEPFMITIVHNEVADKKDPKKTVTYANITDADGSYMIQAPQITDPIEKTTKKLNVPEALSELRAFIWEIPTLESWESLYIDGTRTKKAADGSEEEVSKNYLQEQIIGAVNFPGSPLEEMLNGGEGLVALEEALEVEEEEQEQEEQEEVAEAPKPVAKKTVAPVAKTAPAAKAKTTTAPTAAPAATKAATATKPVATAAKAPAKQGVAQAKPAAKAKAAAQDPLAMLGLL